MKHSTRKILAIRVALAVAVASTTLLAFGSTIGAHIQSALASGISSVTDYYVPGSDPWGTAFDSSGRVWVALPGCDFAPSCPSSTPPGKLALFDPVAQGWVTVVSLPAGYGQPIFVAVDPNSNVWWSEGWVSAIGMLNVAAAQPGTNKGVTEYFYTPSCSSCGSHTSGIIADRQSLIWLDDSLQNTFGSFPIGGGSFSFYNSPSGGHSHDGLNVDSQNRIWYDEEFANKLAEAIQGSSTPTTTPTSSSPTSTPTSTNTPTPTPTTTASTTLGKDTFQRANQFKWGAASDGQTWGGDANSQGVFSISGNAGLVSNTAAASYSAVLGPTASNAEVYASGSLSSFTNSNFGDVLRWTDGNNWYKAFIDGASLVIQKKVNGTTTILASVPFRACAGTSYTIHFGVVGSTLTANVWAASGSEPSGWMVTASDSTFTSGYCGMRFLTQNGTATVTSFQAKSL